MNVVSIVKFTNVISNNGRGYVTDGVNEGKFIPPYNGKKTHAEMIISISSKCVSFPKLKKNTMKGNKRIYIAF